MGTVQIDNTTNSNGSNVTISKGGDELVWHNPLKECVIRWQTNALGGMSMADKEAATFGVTRDAHKGLHQGLDILAKPGNKDKNGEGGDDCIAVAKGTFSTIGAPVYAPNSFGLQLVLKVKKSNLPSKQRKHFEMLCSEHDEVYFVYCHCSYVDKSLIGQEIAAGTVIGKSGNTGNSGFLKSKETGAHVHFEVRLKDNPSGGGLSGRLDPMPFIENLQMPRGKFKTWNPFYPHDVPLFFKDEVFHFSGAKFEKRGESGFEAVGGQTRRYKWLTANEVKLFELLTKEDIPAGFPYI